jgi:integrase
MRDFWRGLQKSCDNTQIGKNALQPATVRRIISRWLGTGTRTGIKNAFIAAAQFWGVKRASEILSLRRSQIRRDGSGGYSLYFHTQKNDPFGRGQRVPLPAKAHDGFDVAEIVRRFLDFTQPLGESAPLARSTVRDQWTPRPLTRDAWNRALRLALHEDGFSGHELHMLSSHSLRKGGYTALLRAGVPEDCARAVIGNKSSRSAAPYIRRPWSDLVAAAGRI